MIEGLVVVEEGGSQMNSLGAKVSKGFGRRLGII